MVSAEGRKGWRYKDVTSSGIMLEMVDFQVRFMCICEEPVVGGILVCLMCIMFLIALGQGLGVAVGALLMKNCNVRSKWLRLLTWRTDDA